MEDILDHSLQSQKDVQISFSIVNYYSFTSLLLLHKEYFMKKNLSTFLDLKIDYQYLVFVNLCKICILHHLQNLQLQYRVGHCHWLDKCLLQNYKLSCYLSQRQQLVDHFRLNFFFLLSYYFDEDHFDFHLHYKM